MLGFREELRRNFRQRLQLGGVSVAIGVAILVLGTLGYWGVTTMANSLSKSGSSTQALDDLRELNSAVQKVLANPLGARFSEVQGRVSKLRASLDAMYDAEAIETRRHRRAIGTAKAAAMVIVDDLEEIRDNAVGAAARTSELQALASEFDVIASSAIRDLAEAAQAETDKLEVSIGPLAKTASLLDGIALIATRLDAVAAAATDAGALRRLADVSTDMLVKEAGRLRFKVDKAHRPVVGELSAALEELQTRLEAQKAGEPQSAALLGAVLQRAYRAIGELNRLPASTIAPTYNDLNASVETARALTSAQLQLGKAAENLAAFKVSLAAFLADPSDENFAPVVAHVQVARTHIGASTIDLAKNSGTFRREAKLVSDAVPSLGAALVRIREIEELLAPAAQALIGNAAVKATLTQDIDRSMGGVADAVVSLSADIRDAGRTAAQRSALVVALALVLPGVCWAVASNILRLRDRRSLELSKIDPLTNAQNRGSINETIHRVFSSRNDERFVAVIFVDVDHFKDVNDTWGHECGDRVLLHFADCIRAVLANCEFTLGRYGGDEFIVVLEGDRASSPDQLFEVDALCDQIRAEVRRPITYSGQCVETTASIGAHITQVGETIDEALLAADLALYESKRLGRDRATLFVESLKDTYRRRQTVEAALKRALAEDLLQLHFQPICHVDTLELAGFEALLRLEDASGGFIPPSEFIPIAEEAGLIDEIGRWVLDTAVSAARTWPGDQFVAVNLSVKQFRTGKLPSIVSQVLENHGFPPHRLELEVTEEVLIDDKDSAAYQIKSIQEIGVSISIDDFGSGYSNFNYLWQFAFDKIKIDRTLMPSSTKSPEVTSAVFAGISHISKKMALKVVAEGVENKEDLAFVREHNVEFVQGYYLGRPTPAEKLSQFWETKRRAAGWRAPGATAA